MRHIPIEGLDWSVDAAGEQGAVPSGVRPHLRTLEHEAATEGALPRSRMPTMDTWAGAYEAH
eukprot:8292784-Pyramimonas_sp.AAC.1